MTIRHRTIIEVLGDSLAKLPVPRLSAPEGRRAVIVMSRQPGARGAEVARVLAGELGFHVYDRELIQRIAESTHLSERLVSALDEKDRSVLAEWIESLGSGVHLTPYGYLFHLTHVVTAIARLGDAIILGRGAHLILPPGEALRVLVVAPLRERIATVAAREGWDSRRAERRIAEQEAERGAFLRKYFKADFGDPTAFDLVVNTAVLGVGGAADATRSALSRLPAHTRS